jgi:hypothetical protein
MILDTYTLDVANSFLREIDKQEMRAKVGRIYETRIAGATEKSFKTIMAQLRAQERRIELIQAKQEKRIPTPTPPTFEERQAREAQQHVRFSELSADEQALREQMWAKVPEHLRARAKELAGR